MTDQSPEPAASDAGEDDFEFPDLTDAVESGMSEPDPEPVAPTPILAEDAHASGGQIETVHVRPEKPKPPYVLRALDEVEREVGALLTDPSIVAALRERDLSRQVDFGAWRDGSKHVSDSGYADAVQNAIVGPPHVGDLRSTLLLAIQSAEDRRRTAIDEVAKAVHNCREALVGFEHYTALSTEHRDAMKTLGVWDDEKDAYEPPAEPEAPATIPDSMIL